MFIKIRHIFLLVFFIAGLFVSCQANKSEEILDGLGNTPYVFHFSSYVCTYHSPCSLFLLYNEPYVSDTLDKITIVFEGSDSYIGSGPLYEAIGIKHNDTAFNEIWYHNYPTYFGHVYLAFDLVSISVTSNADYDTEHPAGVLLNDIIQYTAYSPYEYIQSGYSNLVPEKKKIDKPLSKCVPEDFILTLAKNYEYGENYPQRTPACNLQFLYPPTLSQQHTLTVVVVDDSGKTWENSLDMDWNNQ